MNQEAKWHASKTNKQIKMARKLEIWILQIKVDVGTMLQHFKTMWHFKTWIRRAGGGWGGEIKLKTWIWSNIWVTLHVSHVKVTWLYY